MLNRVLLIIAIIAFILNSNLGCINPFAPKLENEMIGQSCTDLRNIDELFCVFRNSYTFKDTTIYGSLLAPEFTFSYVDYERGIEVSWGRDDEMRSAYGLFHNVQNLALTWNNVIFSAGDTTLHSVIRGFNLTVTFTPGDIIRVDGYANLTFERLNSNADWKIVHWHDESNF